MTLLNSGIYKILNTFNGHFYIGSSVKFNKRWTLHKSQLNRNIHRNHYLQSAWNKYSEWRFEFIILEYCDKSKLVEREQYYIDTLKPKYNLAPKANSMVGFKHTEEFKRKRSIARKGKTLSEEAKLKVSLANKGRIVSLETRLKMSEANKKRNPETRFRPIGPRPNRRKLDKWPHGCKCNCDDCIELRRLYDRQHYRKTYKNYVILNCKEIQHDT